MTTHGGIGTDIHLSFASSPEGVELTGESIAGGKIVISASSADFVAGQLLQAARAHRRLVTHVEAGEEALVEVEAAARKKLDELREQERSVREEWMEASRALIAQREKRLPKEYELTFAFAKCPCGAHLAYWSGVWPTAWECSDVLLGNVGTPEDKAVVADGTTEMLGGQKIPEKTEDGKIVHKSFPFAFFKIKADHTRHTPR